MEPPRKVILAYAKAFAVVSAAVAIGWLAGWGISCRWGHPSASVRLFLQLTSGAITIAAALGFLVDVETWGKDTPAERLNRLLLWLFYGLGSFVLALSLSW